MTESHLDTPRSLSKQPGLTLITRTWVGDYDSLEEFAKTLTVGREVETISSIDITKDDIPDGFLAAAELASLNGKRGRLSLTIAKHQENVEVWGLEPAEIQKPIRTWMADAQNTADRPDLTLLDNWAAQAGNQALADDYHNYRWNGQELSGNTKKLAEMIRQGIESYLVYTPVVTCVTRLNEIPDDIGEDLGKICKPASKDSDMNDAVTKLAALAEDWLKTADRIQGALDGTFTRTQQWTGADKWNENLYQTASSGTQGD